MYRLFSIKDQLFEVHTTSTLYTLMILVGNPATVVDIHYRIKPILISRELCDEEMYAYSTLVSGIFFWQLRFVLGFW